MEIKFEATIGTCSSYRESVDAEPTDISIVIAPLKVTEDSASGKVQIISGCNMFQSCHNPDCWYSKEARQNKKAPAGK